MDNKCTFCSSEAVTTTTAGHSICADCAKAMGEDRQETADAFLRVLKPETPKEGAS